MKGKGTKRNLLIAIKLQLGVFKVFVMLFLPEFNAIYLNLQGLRDLAGY
jgi:hypothetical protein